MELILGGINGKYLRDINAKHQNSTDEVVAAVAYATDSRLLFDWCWKNSIPLKFYGRLDEDVAVAVPILESFIARKSANFTCRLVQHHHAKVIWWKGAGIYIGSANITDSAWHKNIEAGCFFSDSEIDDRFEADLHILLATLHKNSTPLTEELLMEMKNRSSFLNSRRPDLGDFWGKPSFITWAGLVSTTPKMAYENQKNEFLKEWHATLQTLRDISELVAKRENRPSWVSEDAPLGAQADQFLHAHYYQRTFEGRKAMYAMFYETNKHRSEEALTEALTWWRDLPHAPSHEDTMLNTTAPFLKRVLSQDRLLDMTEDGFREICMGVHSIKDYARRVPNKSVGLADDGTHYTIPQKVAALSKRIWNDRSKSGLRVNELIQYIIYDGTEEQIPERLWQAVMDENFKIDGLGISAFGELIGWALPDRFPPRNGRTSKALKSLGYDVAVHVE